MSKSVHVRVPVTIAVGPVPENLTSPSEIFQFGLANIKSIFSERGISANIDGEHALATFSLRDEAAKTQTARGLVLDNRAFRIQPAGEKHALELSNDLGASFNIAGSFDSYDFADAVGTAWVAGRVEVAA